MMASQVRTQKKNIESAVVLEYFHSFHSKFRIYLNQISGDCGELCVLVNHYIDRLLK